MPDDGGSKTIHCLRCQTELVHAGVTNFPGADGRWGFFLGDVQEAFSYHEHFDVYVCPHCGRTEFFVDGIGEQLRPR